MKQLVKPIDGNVAEIEVPSYVVIRNTILSNVTFLIRDEVDVVVYGCIFEFVPVIGEWPYGGTWTRYQLRSAR